MAIDITLVLLVLLSLLRLLSSEPSPRGRAGGSKPSPRDRVDDGAGGSSLGSPSRTCTSSSGWWSGWLSSKDPARLSVTSVFAAE